MRFGARVKVYFKKLDIIKELHQNNESIASMTHAVGIFLATAAATLLITFACLFGTRMHVIGFSVFSIALILLYAASSIYHFFPRGTLVKRIFQQIDHSMIFIFIAASYTPIALTIDDRFFGWLLFGFVWLFAGIGVGLKVARVKIPDLVSTSLYVIIGASVFIIMKPLLAWMSVPGLWWLFAAGFFQLLGALFFSLESVVLKDWKFGMHEIFHICVMIGTGSFCWFLLRYVLYV